MPAKPMEPKEPWEDVHSGLHLPVWHCAFQGCSWWGPSVKDLTEHLTARHGALFASCRESTCCAGFYTDMDLYEEAIASKERVQFPLVGPSVDRRSIELLTETYNDVQTLA